ncbi:hypothetical protein RHSIM_RhsimUnG0191700 [Rhododendron simsii]|uniref:Uncharacterized protein n=1 Tax=Rhododendron simsii TaxID=118357 RepID=A0A834L470_RHOSS|nr:hypothetical protein RHSIM_RhsimUnG0191700 [Rhododendron simsii]
MYGYSFFPKLSFGRTPNPKGLGRTGWVVDEHHCSSPAFRHSFGAKTSQKSHESACKVKTMEDDYLLGGLALDSTLQLKILDEIECWNESFVTSGRDGALNIERPREGTRDSNDAERPREGPRDSSNDAEIPSQKGPRDRNDDDNGPFKLAKTFLGLTFQAGLGLMIYREQPPQGDSSTHLSSLSSALLTTVGATTLFAFAFTMSGMMLQRHHPNVANFWSYAGVLLGALGFFFMMDIFATEGLVWLVWAVGGVLFLVFAYTLRRELEI